MSHTHCKEIDQQAACLSPDLGILSDFHYPLFFSKLSTRSVITLQERAALPNHKHHQKQALKEEPRQQETLGELPESSSVKTVFPEKT